jgi:hypothetical protein
VPSPYAPTTKHRPDGSIETKLSSPYDSSPTKHTIRSIDESMGGRLLWQERYQTSRPLQNARQRHRAARERTWQAKEISIMPLGYFSGVHIIAIATKVNHDLVLHMRYKSSTCATRVPHALRNHRPTPRTVDHGIVYRRLEYASHHRHNGSRHGCKGIEHDGRYMPTFRRLRAARMIRVNVFRINADTFSIPHHRDSISSSSRKQLFRNQAFLPRP